MGLFDGANPRKGSSGAILKSYFMGRKAGYSHEEAVRLAVESRYHSGDARQELLDRFWGVVRDQPVPAEAEQVRTLCRILHWHEHGFDHDLQTVASFNANLQRLSDKYGIHLNEAPPSSQSAPAAQKLTQSSQGPGSASQAAIVTCTSCRRRLRVPSDRGPLVVSCPGCGNRFDHAP